MPVTHSVCRVFFMAILTALILGCNADGFNGLRGFTEGPSSPTGNLGVANCSATQSPFVPQFWAGSGVTDVTFMAVGDSQVYLDSSNSSVSDSGYSVAVDALNGFNALGNQTWASLGINEPVDKIRGLLMAGDITQNGRDGREAPDNELGVFAREYGLCGNARLTYPVYEGYGNHDYREWNNLLYPIGSHPVADSISIRNGFRAGLSNKAAGTQGHYTWQWDNVHFINLNLTVSDTVPNYGSSKPPGTHDPRLSLTYLQSELARIGSTEPVVLIHHYPPASGLSSASLPDVNGYMNAISGNNVIAIIHGHIHSVGSGASYFNGVPTFHAGYALRHFELGGAANNGTFRVFRITNNKLLSLAVKWVKNPADNTFSYTLLSSSAAIDL